MSHLLPIQWPQPQNEEILLAMEEVEFKEKVRQLRQVRASVRCRRASTPDSEQRPETRGIGESLKHQEFFSCTSRDGSGG